MEINDLVPVRSPLIGWSSMGREHMLLNLRSGECSSLEWFQGEIWKMCDGVNSVGGIVRHLEGVSSLPQGEARRAILEILGAFNRDELITFCAAARACGEDHERKDNACHQD
jgi:hypothetical protein